MTTAQDIRDYYYRPDKDAILLGAMIHAHRKATGISQQALSRQVGTSAGALHHYESLLRLPAELQAKVRLYPKAGAQKRQPNELTFKEARAIADLDTHELMLKHATPFLNSTLSGCDVEPYIKLVKQYPDAEPEKVVDMLKHPENYVKGRYKFDVESAVPDAPEPEQYVTPAHIKQASINFRALLQLCNWDLTVDSMYACRQLEQLQAEIGRTLAAQKVMA